MKKHVRRSLIILTLLGAFLGSAALPSQSRQAAVPGCTEEDLTSAPDAIFTQGDVEVSTDTAGYRCCLTFDDGPSENTEKVLKILADEQVTATFFVIAADNNREWLPLVQKEQQQGCQVGLHSCSHRYSKIYDSTDDYWADIDALKAALQPYIDTNALTCLRFPGGSTNTVSHKYGGSHIMQTLKTQAEEKGYHWVDWNVCADDAVGGHPSASKVFRNTIEDVGDQTTCVVLMHDTAATDTTVEALPQIIAWFKEKGFHFFNVSDLYIGK